MRTNFIKLFCCGLCIAAALMDSGRAGESLAITTMTDLDAQNWSAAGEEDGHHFRAVQPKKTALLPFAAWWTETNRPVRDDNRLLTIVFKDTTTQPVPVLLHSGLPSSTELHRIGGLADGQWKTAHIPLPWDMIWRLADRPGMTGIYLKNPGDAAIPVESICILPANPAKDEARWQAETLAWVARVQADARATAKTPPAQTPVNASSDAALIAFVRPPVRLIHTTSAPQDGETGTPLAIRLARSEIETGQFGLYSPAGVANVTAQLAAPLQAADGTPFAGEVTLFTAEYAVTRKNELFPQRYWPNCPATVPAGASHSFFVEVSTTDATTPGTYTGDILLSGDGGASATLPVSVEVLPFHLLTMSECKYQMNPCVTGLLPAHELEFLVRNNLNGTSLWYYNFPFRMKSVNEDGSFEIDFTIYDDQMKHAADAGMDHFVYFLGGDPYLYPESMFLQRELYRQVIHRGDTMAGRIEQVKKMANKDIGLLPELRPVYKAWVKQFMQHAEENNWPEPILTPFDEPAKWAQAPKWAEAEIYLLTNDRGERYPHPIKRRELETKLQQLKEQGRNPEFLCQGGAGPWIKSQFKDCCAAIHEAWPSARIYASIHHAKDGLPFLEDVEVFCTNAIHEDRELGDKVRAASKDGEKYFWQYSGVSDNGNYAHPRYTYGFFHANFDAVGGLCWAYNWGKRFDTRQGSSWLFGWTTPYNVVRGPYMDGIREGWDDRRYIQTLRKLAQEKGKANEVETMIKGELLKAVQARGEGGRDTVHDFFARTNDPEMLDTLRGKIIAKILELME